MPRNPSSNSGHTRADSLYIPATCRIEAVSELTPQEKLFRVSLPDGRPLGHRPGQFVQVSLLGWGEAPISVASSPTREGYFELGVRQAGTLTSAMHRLEPGDTLGIRGPFGNPFDLERMSGRDLLLISGGCGLAPLRSLIQYCEDRPEQFGRVCILYGAKSPADILFKEEIRTWEASASFACATTVDNLPGGACYEGQVGQVTRLIPPLEIDAPRTLAAIVGPPVMYRPVIDELKQKGLTEAQIAISLERHMRCGVGKCGHCTIEHLYCCSDGPVFWLSEVSGLRGAL
ncbi:oxidoreductase [Desulfuromonas versatilis]|uniref:Oxidoreductase n=1 Tax=Desulfuromonas versatilis TaxID=2802975 RepID=A0ABM8HPB3_9BACT|nr:FAD/NAD(P)-binding protein [Desulfuromonas versatilis]BCR03466.1 oxidoreductase [Desulfuromonas versatilis]